MREPSLQERVAALERKVAELQAEKNGAREKDWEKSVGMFTGDEVMKRIHEQARKFREADRRKARRPKKRAKQS
jgi:hypothetical protein